MEVNRCRFKTCADYRHEPTHITSGEIFAFADRIREILDPLWQRLHHFSLQIKTFQLSENKRAIHLFCVICKPNKNRWRITLKLIFNKLAKEGVPWFHLAQGR